MNNQYTIATIGSHSALQILKGAKDEGFNYMVYSSVIIAIFWTEDTFEDAEVATNK